MDVGERSAIAGVGLPLQPDALQDALLDVHILSTAFTPTNLLHDSEHLP
jgi:hypothetical protein